MRRPLRTVLVVIALVGTAACAHRATVSRVTPGQEFGLALAGEYALPRGTTVDGDLVVGGISGIAIERRTGALLGISDNRESGRVVRFDVRGEGAAFTVRPTGATRLAMTGAASVIDPEAIALAGDSLLVSTEGNGDGEPRVPPGILRYDRTGRLLDLLPVPRRFVPSVRGPLTSGVRRNEAFESLTITPDGRRLFTASETAPVQDGPSPTVERGAVTRILEYERGVGQRWTPRREFAYPLEPVDSGGLTPTFTINGLVELLALGGNDLLALERSFAMEGQDGRQVNRIRLYRVSLDGASDVSTVPALSDAANVPVLTKRLVLDLNDVTGLSPGLRAGLDNFEGIALGPRLADGASSLLMVSDDNFSARQNTVFLLFRFVSRPSALTSTIP